MRKRFFMQISLIIICALWLTLGLARAQTSNATLQGTVTDPKGSVIPNATVKVQSEDTGLARTAVTEESGIYVFNFLPVGKYVVTASASGFKGTRIQNIIVEIGQTRTLDVALEVGAVEQTVEVVESAPPLDRGSAVIGTVVQSQQIKELPLNGRNWAGLMLLAPGAINTGDGSHLSVRFVGRARDDNNWSFDGIDSTGVKDPRQEASLRLVISMDSISEFRVNSTLYSADSGGGAGGQVQVVSRNGTNKFRGSVFEFLRNDAFDARVFVDPGELPPFRMNQFGGNVGGPIAKDKTFFFFNYEGIRQTQGQTFISAVPNAATRASVAAASPALAAIVNAYPRGARARNATTDDAVVERTFRTREDSAALRFDHRFSDQNSLYARYSVDDGVLRVPLDAGAGLRTDRVRPSNFVLQFQRIFSPTVINEAKLGFNRSPLTRINSGPFLEQFSVSGFMTLTRNQEVTESGTSFSLVDNLSLQHGRHNLRVGGEVRRIHVNVGEGEPITVTYSSLANFTANRLESFSINPFPVRGGRRWYYFGYAQDDFKWRPNLTLNLGLRYEYYSVVHEVKERARVFALECGGFCPPGTPWYEPDRNNFAPRLGLAWAPNVFKGKTVIRAGYGVFFGPGQNDDVFAAIDSSADRISLDRATAPNLSYPFTPFLPLAATVGATPRALQRDRRDLYSLNYSLSVQHELPKQFVMQVGYVGGQGHKLFARSFINVVDPRTGQRPLPAFGRIDYKANDGNSNFHGLQVSLHRQFQGGLLVGAQYMWSHSINDGSVGGGEAAEPQNINDRRADRGNSAQDIRHTLTTNWIYELPFGQGRRFLKEGVVEKILGGWQLTGLAQARTGRQLTISTPRTTAAGDLPDRNNTNQRPDLVAGASLIPSGGQSVERWINPAAFSIPPLGRWGTAGRSLLSGPGLLQFDLGLGKRVPFSEGRSVEFRWEAFNVFNRAQLGNPNTNFVVANPDQCRAGNQAGCVVDSNFGRVTAPLNRNFGTGTNRQMQFMLRLNF
ncbi:MAG: TonB-dependent receptor domain-containing protein [Blastocatellia bacterium]